jgi:zinc transport system substrate-binding protein
VLFIAALFLISGCNTDVSRSTASDSQDENNLTIITSFYPVYIMAQNITADVPGVKLINLTGPQTGCLHDYQLTPENVKTLQQADIFIVNGAGTESFMDKVTAQQKQLKIITASQGIKLINNTGQTDPNPHVWVSIAGAIQEVKSISRQLSELDPARAPQYEQNSAAYIAKLERLREEMHAELDKLPQRNIVSFHEAFPYFAEEFDLNIVAVVEREPGSEPSAREIAQTIEIVKSSKAPALFVEPQYPSKSAEVIAKETGARVYVLDPAVTGPDDPDAYLNIMKNNLAALKEALR